MLWTDSIFVTPSDLADVDSEIPTIAAEEGIALSGTKGFIRRQIDEAGLDVLRRINVYGGWVGDSSLSANHIQAVLNTGGGAQAAKTKILLNNIVVSDLVAEKWSSIKQWVVYKTVIAMYRNAYSRTASKDRYKTKMNEFSRVMLRHQDFVFLDLGLPAVVAPLPCPGALLDIDPGTFGTDNLTQIAGAGTVEGDYSIVVTYVDQSLYRSYQEDGNAESAPSERAHITLASGNVMKIDISSLNPPTGTMHPGLLPWSSTSFLKATGWNVYAASDDATLHLQNSTPIPIETKTFTFDGDPDLTKSVVRNGQYPTVRYQFQRLMHRA